MNIKKPISSGAKQAHITIKEQIRYQNSYSCKIKKASAQRNKKEQQGSTFSHKKQTHKT